MFFKRRRKKKFTILGSCVSRDMMEYLDPASYEISLYIARTKIVSQLSSPLYVNEDEIRLNSAFQKRLVLCDLNKQEMDFARQNRSDYCIIDYIDERFNLLRIHDTYITKSNELVTSQWLQGKNYEETPYQFDGTAWRIGENILDEYLKKYLDQILRLYTPPAELYCIKLTW